MSLPHSLLAALSLPVISVRRGARRELATDPNEIVCQCLNITQGTIDAAIADGCASYEEISARTGCGTVCGGCEPRIRGVADWAPVEILDAQRVTSDVLRLRFRPRRARQAQLRVPPHLAGQHVRLRGRVGDRWLERTYTLTTGASTRGYQELLIQRRTDGAFSQWLFETQVARQRLEVSAPRGNFVWRPGHRPTVCWVAGIGVTPALAIVRTAEQANLSAPIYVDLSFRHPASAAGLDVLQAVAASTTSITVKLRITSEAGRLTAQDVASQVERFPGAQHVVCGPSSYAETVCRALDAHGVAADDILIERFEAAAQVGDTPIRGRASLRPRGASSSSPSERSAEVVRDLVRENLSLGNCPMHVGGGNNSELRLHFDGDTPGIHDNVGYVATTYSEVQNIPALEASCAALTLPTASPASTWRAVLQSVELSLDIAARLADDVADRLEAGEVDAAAERMDWLAGVHSLLCALADAGWRATGPLDNHASHRLSVQASPARNRLMRATRRIDRAMRVVFEQPDPQYGDQMGALLARGRLCEPMPRLDRAACISMERWRVWERSLSAVPIDSAMDYPSFVDADGVARVVERPAYDSSTLINPFRGLHLVQERLAREAVDQLDRASSELEKPPCSPEAWENSWRSIRRAVYLMAPMREALCAMTEGLAVAEYRRFRKNFGRTSASESAALSDALFHRAPERVGEAFAGALRLVEGEPVLPAVDRLASAERVFARGVLEAIDELHRAVAAWLDVHMLLPVLHLGKARSLAGRIDAVTSNRLKRRETLSRGWFGKLGAPAVDEVVPSAELDAENGYLAWRALRLGDVQVADAAHLAEDQPAGRLLERLAAEVRRIERE